MFTRLLSVLGISKFWTISDWTEFWTCETEFEQFFISAVVSFALFSFLLHDMSMGFIRVETTVICFAVM